MYCDWLHLKMTLRAEAKHTIGYRRTRLFSRCLRSWASWLNPLLRGWDGYFGFSQLHELSSLDGWTRRRLRCVVWVQWKTRGTVRLARSPAPETEGLSESRGQPHRMPRWAIDEAVDLVETWESEAQQTEA